jgi:hypothetical protein
VHANVVADFLGHFADLEAGNGADVAYAFTPQLERAPLFHAEDVIVEQHSTRRHVQRNVDRNEYGGEYSLLGRLVGGRHVQQAWPARL